MPPLMKLNILSSCGEGGGVKGALIRKDNDRVYVIYTCRKVSSERRRLFSANSTSAWSSTEREDER